MVFPFRRFAPLWSCPIFFAITIFFFWLVILVKQDNELIQYHPTKSRLLLNDILPSPVLASKNRTYEISLPVNISGVHAFGAKGYQQGPLLTPAMAGFQPDFQLFVELAKDRRSLTLGDRPFFITGVNNYYMHSRAVWKEFGRLQVDEVFASAKRVGFNVLRCWAFGDGDVWNALQPEEGIMDEMMFRNGLDYIVTEARKHNIRLILTLTNGMKEFGGMVQYVKWAGKQSISEFYSDLHIKSAYKDYVYTVINRINTIDKVAYKDNPTILGWDLANEPRDPGFPGSVALQDWTEEMSAYVKELDPNHLVMIGWEGVFGPSTPEKTKFNGYRPEPIPLSEALYRMDYVCHGPDFFKNHIFGSIDLAVAHLYPDSWLACDEVCQMQFSKTWIWEHLELAAKLKLPFLLGEFGKQKPITNRNAFFRMVYSELHKAHKMGYPVAGSLVWMLADPQYPDYDGFTLYEAEEASIKTRPDLPLVDMDALSSYQQIMNRDVFLKCIQTQAEKFQTSTGQRWNEGWNETLTIIKNYTQSVKA